MDYEKARLAEYIAPRLLEARQAEVEDTGIDEESLKANIQTDIGEILVRHGIPRGGVDFGQKRTRAYTGDSRLRRYFDETTVPLEIAGGVTRQQILAAIMEIEDTHPFIKARELELNRSRDDDYHGVDSWQAEITFVWFEHRAREAQ